MTLIVKTKSKSEERVLKAFLTSLNIGFHTPEEEDAALYNAMIKGRKSKLLTKNEKAFFLKQLQSKK